MSARLDTQGMFEAAIGFPEQVFDAAARARGKRPGRQPLDRDRAEAALKLVAAGLSPIAAARQVGLGRLTVYRELRRTGADRPTAPP